MSCASLVEKMLHHMSSSEKDVSNRRSKCSIQGTGESAAVKAGVGGTAATASCGEKKSTMDELAGIKHAPQFVC